MEGRRIRRGFAALGSVAVPRPDLFVCIGSEVGSSARNLAMYIYIYRGGGFCGTHLYLFLDCYSQTKTRDVQPS